MIYYTAYWQLSTMNFPGCWLSHYNQTNGSVLRNKVHNIRNQKKLFGNNLFEKKPKQGVGDIAKFLKKSQEFSGLSLSLENYKENKVSPLENSQNFLGKFSQNSQPWNFNKLSHPALFSPTFGFFLEQCNKESCHIIFMKLNRFCPLSKARPIPLFLTDNIKLEEYQVKLNSCLFYIAFKFGGYLL